MDADKNPQVESEPLIEADLGENGGKVSFASIEEARDWAGQERSRWQDFWSKIEVGGLARDVLDRQIELPTKIRDALNGAEQFPDSHQPETLREIEKLFERYADYASLCSKSPVGQQILDGNQRRHGFLKVGMLASTLRIPTEDVLEFGQGDEQQSAMILSGYAIGEMRNVVKRSDIADVQSRMDKQLAKMTTIVERAETNREEIENHGKRVTDELERQREAQQSQWNEFHTAADEEWQSLRRVFEEHLRLEAPATYLEEQSKPDVPGRHGITDRIRRPRSRVHLDDHGVRTRFSRNPGATQGHRGLRHPDDGIDPGVDRALDPEAHRAIVRDELRAQRRRDDASDDDDDVPRLDERGVREDHRRGASHRPRGALPSADTVQGR